MLTPNAFAPIALLAWIPLTLLLFWRLKPGTACAIVLIGASTLLPVNYGWNFVGFPALQRESISVLAALVACFVFARGRVIDQPKIAGIEWLAVVMVAAGFLTAMGNRDVVWSGERMLPPMSMWGGVSRMASTVLQFWAPIYLGRILCRNPRELRAILIVLMVFGLGYAVLVVWEARMSPRLHHQLYGYLPASWKMAMRRTGWGWRPMVFVGHGLALTMFMVISALASAALWRARVRVAGLTLAPVPPFLWAVVFVCQSLASLVYATVTLPLLAFARVPVQRWVIIGLTALVLAYPALRTADLFPTEMLIEVADFEGGRSRSLEMRFDMEDVLLEKARQRPWFGWGGYGRERRYDLQEMDLGLGKGSSVSDGYWIIIFGQRGLVGFLCAFGMLTLPALLAARASGRRPLGSETYLVLGTAWICAVAAVDLLPNGFLTPHHTFFAGALYGAVRGWRGREVAPPSETTGPRDASPSPPIPRGSSLSDGLLGRRTGPRI